MSRPTATPTPPRVATPLEQQPRLTAVLEDGEELVGHVLVDLARGGQLQRDERLVLVALLCRRRLLRVLRRQPK